MPAQIKDRIPNHLPRPVKRNIPTAIALEHLDPASRQCVAGSKHVSSFRIAPQSDHRRVFKQQQHISDLSGLAQIDKFSLQAQPLGIIDDAELNDGYHG